MSAPHDTTQFAPEADLPLPYLHRIRTYYQALGYGAPYRWAQYAEVPFAPLAKPLSETRVALVTTAAPYDPDKGDQGPRSAYNAAAKFYRVYSEATAGEPDVRISHVGIDRKHTSQEDINTWFPLAQMKRLTATGRIGEVAPRFHGLPTNRSQRTTLEQDCPDLLRAVREDTADVAVLAAN
jgi:hypothetical protein